MKITSNSTHNRQKRQKAQNDKQNSFLKELVENADLHKPELNKAKTTNKSCVKYDFVAPLNTWNVARLSFNSLASLWKL